MRGLSKFLLACALLSAASLATAGERKPVYIGQTGEFLLENSTSAQSIERGIRIAIDEINRSGGVLGGRPLALLTRDDHSVPARGVANVRHFAQHPDLVAVFTGRFSPLVFAAKKATHETGMILLAPWSSANGIADGDVTTNYVFRLSLRDSMAIPTMLMYAAASGTCRIGLLLLNSAWGRSNLAAAEYYLDQHPELILAGVEWFDWTDQSLLNKYRRLRHLGAQAIVLVANDREGAVLVREVAALPEEKRLPIISHWGVTGGNFIEQIGDPSALEKVDFTVIQTFSFHTADADMVRRVGRTARRLFDIAEISGVEAPVGLAHAYDLTHILARAIDMAGSTDRAAVRKALENVRNYRGLVKTFEQPFSAEDHEALGPDDAFMARYRPDGQIVPVKPGTARTDGALVQ